MKRLLTLLALVLCSCAETFVGEEIARPNNENLPDLTAAFAEEDNTRTYIEDGKYLRWHEDDRLTIFYGNTLNRQYKFNGATGDNSGTFSLVPDGMLGTGNAFDHIYALYPYNADARITDEGIISLTLPAVQNYAENSFGRGANTMIAVTENLEDTFLAFKNACGYLKLRLYNAEGASIKSIEVKGNSGERLAGAATATIAFGEAPVLAMADDATTSVILNCGEGVALGTTAETATEFWVTLPATIFAEGLTITATDTEGGVFEKSTTNEVIIERNAIQPMATLKAEFVVYTPNPDEQNTFITDVDDAYIVGFEGGEVVVAVTTNMEYKVVIPAEAKSWISVGETRAAVREETLTLIIAENEITEERSAIVTLKDKRDNILQDINITQSARLNTVANNEIWYTATEKVMPYDRTVFGATYLSNEWNSDTGEGIITFDGEVTSIGEDAFYRCYNLTSITIPNSVTEIGKSAFYTCSGLTSIVIPNSVTTIGKSVFYSCGNLKSVTIPNSVTKIGEYTFAYCDNLTSVTIPDSVTSIGEWAFNECRNLTSVTIGDSVTTIGPNAFYLCSNLTSVTIGNSVTTIGDAAFYCCTSLTNINIPNSATTIGNSAFWSCISLTSITIPDSVTSIGFGAFRNCKNLKSATIGDSVTTIGDAVFYGCNNLTEFRGKYTEDNGRILVVDGALNSFAPAGLTEYTIPNSVTSIGRYAFYSCSSLKSVTIPDSVTTIGKKAFYSCASLASVTIGDSVTTIGDEAFYSCASLTSITIGNSVTTIGEWAFKYCKITSVTIPSSITTIGKGAFSDCTSLTSVYCKATTPPSLGDRIYVFYTNGTNLKFYVPYQSIDKYKSKDCWWSDYADAIVAYDFEKGEIVEGDGGNIQNGSYTVTLNNAWRESTSVSNPGSSLYDGVYESYSNYNVNNGVATMYIDIDGYSEFSIYVRSDAESTYDYVTVSELDSTSQKVSTSGKQNSGTALSNYTKVTYTGIDGGKHRITVIYKKDSSQHSGTDRGYLIIPKNQ